MIVRGWRVGEKYKTFWAYAGPIVAIAGAASFWRPNIAISSGISIDQKQTYAGQFLITNNGKLPVYNVRLRCSLMAKELIFGPLGVLDTGPPSVRKAIPVLDAGQSVSRGCYQISKNVRGAMLQIKVNFTWPIIKITDNRTAYFSVREAENGAILVPEAVPEPVPPEILSIESE